MNADNIPTDTSLNKTIADPMPGECEMTPAARRLVERHLAHIRALLRGARGVVVEEVLADVREHIAAGLRDLGAPVRADEADIKLVLQRLGPPEQWISPDDIPLWRRTLLPMIYRLNIVPKLPLLALAFAALALLVTGTPAPIVFFGIGFCLARAWLAHRGAAIEPWQRWLVYPPLIIVYLVIGVPALLWPGPAIFGGDFDHPHLPLITSLHLPPQLSWQHFAAMAAAVGVWWLAIGIALCLLPAAGRFLLRPFADGFSRRGAALFAGAGTLVSAAAVLLLVLHR